jgi:hypothetical protein
VTPGSYLLQFNSKDKKIMCIGISFFHFHAHLDLGEVLGLSKI